MRITLTGDYQAEKAHVRGEMLCRLGALQNDSVLPRSLNELAIKVGITTVFLYSAGRLGWSLKRTQNLSPLVLTLLLLLLLL